MSWDKCKTIMNKSTWNKIEAELKKCNVGPDLREKESFWKEFKTRSSAIEQEKTIRPPIMPLFNTSAWIKAAAFVAVAAILSVFIVTQRAKEQIFVKNTVKNIEVFASYSAMIILEDDRSDSTIIWLADLDTSNNAQSENL